MSLSPKMHFYRHGDVKQKRILRHPTTLGHFFQTLNQQEKPTEKVRIIISPFCIPNSLNPFPRTVPMELPTRPDPTNPTDCAIEPSTAVQRLHLGPAEWQ
jgi:hypothetical protein